MRIFTLLIFVVAGGIYQSSIYGIAAKMGYAGAVVLGSVSLWHITQLIVLDDNYVFRTSRERSHLSSASVPRTLHRRREHRPFTTSSQPSSSSSSVLILSSLYLWTLVFISSIIYWIQDRNYDFTIYLEILPLPRSSECERRGEQASNRGTNRENPTHSISRHSSEVLATVVECVLCFLCDVVHFPSHSFR